MSAIPTSLTALLTRKQGAAALTEYGYKTAESTLDTVASRGGGPVYRLYGGAVYEWGDLFAWAKSRLLPRRRTAADGREVEKGYAQGRRRRAGQAGPRRALQEASHERCRVTR